MAEKIADAILEIRTDTKKLLAGMKSAKQSADKSMNSMQARADKFAKFMKGAMGIGGVVLIYNKLKRVVGDLVSAYGVQETAEAKLKSAIRASGKEASMSADALFEYASELQGVTTYGDEATLSAMAMLQQLGDLNEEGLKQTIPLVQDFAAAMGVDLETAASLVGKTLGSSTNALSRYGLEIDMTGTKEEKLTNLTDAMRKKFGGMAGELAQTGTGSLKQYNNALGDLKEMGGEVILEFLQPGIKEMTTLMTRTLQAWDAQRKLNKAFAGQASTLQDAKDAFQESQERLNKLNKELKLAEKRGQNANAVNLKLGGTLRDNTGKLKELIEKEEEANAMLLQQMKAMASEEKIRAAVVIVTKSQIEEQDKLNESLKDGVKDLEAWILQQTQIVAGFQDFTDQQIGLNGLMGGFRDGLMRSAEAVDGLTSAYNTASFAGMEFVSGGVKEMKELTAETMRYQVVLQTLAEDTLISFGEALGDAVEVGANGWDYLAEAGKEAIAVILEAFAKQWAVEAIAAYASFNIPKGIGMTAAAGAAFVGAGYVRALATGGDFETRGPQLIMVGENPGGRERITATPLSSPNINGPGGQMVHVTVNVGSKQFYDDIGRATDNGELTIHPRSIKR